MLHVVDDFVRERAVEQVGESEVRRPHRIRQLTGRYVRLESLQLRVPNHLHPPLHGYFHGFTQRCGGEVLTVAVWEADGDEDDATLPGDRGEYCHPSDVVRQVGVQGWADEVNLLVDVIAVLEESDISTKCFTRMDPEEGLLPGSANRDCRDELLRGSGLAEVLGEGVS